MHFKNLLKPNDGLILVDVQKDFCPGGALPIENGDKVVPLLNKWIKAMTDNALPVYASRDWHPQGHISFKEAGGQWPVHCVQDTEGAEFHPDLLLPENVIKVTKGVRFDQDQNSAFDQTGLSFQLEHDGIDKVWIGGLALDVCVFATAIDAKQAGFQVNLIYEGTRPVTVEGGRNAVAKMKEMGISIYE
jgi:nicotinamidase/pyrazinamidase